MIKIESAVKAAIVAVALLLTLSGCALLISADESTGDAIREELRTHETAKVATINFDELVHGDWTQLVIVCDSATNADLDRALGFSWSGAPDAKTRSGSDLFVFSTGSEVEYKYSPEVDDWTEERYFWPCPLSRFDKKWTGDPVVIDRSESKVKFVFVPQGETFPGWYVPWEELDRLTSVDH